MEYRFDPKIQAGYGIIGFFITLIIVFVITREVDWIAAFFVGVGNFAISGFYSTRDGKCK